MNEQLNSLITTKIYSEASNTKKNGLYRLNLPQ